MKTRLQTLLCLIGWFVLIGQAALATENGQDFRQALKYYESGDYKGAVFAFKKVTEVNPGDEAAHYYLANSLAYMHFKDEAAVEYRACLKLNPNSPYAGYCRLALDTLSHRKSAGHDTASGAAAGDVHSSIRTPSTLKNNVGQAESLIEKQASFEKDKNQNLGEALARNASTTADSLGKRIQDQAEHDAQEALRPPRTGIWDPSRAAARADQIRKDAQEMANQAKAAAEHAGAEFRDWSKERQRSIDDVVANLQKQLEGPDDHSGVKLLPQGTDLYTRFYGYGRTSAELPRVRPAAVRIIDKDMDRTQRYADDVIGESAIQKTLIPPGQEPRVVRTVKGSVLDKHD